MNNRFEGAIWYEDIQKLSCCVAGLGATGSWVSILLGRAGVNKMNLVDPDTLESHNLGSQLYSVQELTKTKVEAANRNLQNFTKVRNISYSYGRIENVAYYLNANILLATLDSMAGRKFIFEEFKKRESAKIFIDSRIGAEYYEVYCVTKDYPENMEKYEATLFSDAEGNSGACNYQQSSHSAAMAAGEIVKFITNWLIALKMEEPYATFKVSHDFKTNIYKVE